MENAQYARWSVVAALLAALWMLLPACSDDGGVCVSTSGEVARQVRVTGDFNQVAVYDNVSLILTSDSAGPVVVEAGRNLMGGIKTTVENGVLSLRNTNTCNWLRSYGKPVNVYVSNSKIWRIEYNASGNVGTGGTYRTDSLQVEVWGGCGTIELNLDIWQGRFSLNMGTVDLRLHGLSAITSVYTSDYGLYDARDLQTGFTFITAKGSNDCYVRATQALEATIESIGNIYYTGNPKSVSTEIRGTGRVIPF